MSQDSGRNNFSSLPPEIQREVISHVKRRELLNLACTGKTLRYPGLFQFYSNMPVDACTISRFVRDAVPLGASDFEFVQQTFTGDFLRSLEDSNNSPQAVWSTKSKADISRLATIQRRFNTHPDDVQSLDTPSNAIPGAARYLTRVRALRLWCVSHSELEQLYSFAKLSNCNIPGHTRTESLGKLFPCLREIHIADSMLTLNRQSPLSHLDILGKLISELGPPPRLLTTVLAQQHEPHSNQLTARELEEACMGLASRLKTRTYSTTLHRLQEDCSYGTRYIGCLELNFVPDTFDDEKETRLHRASRVTEMLDQNPSLTVKMNNPDVNTAAGGESMESMI